MIEAAARLVGPGGHGSAVVTPLPADSPPGEFGPHQPGDGAPPEPRARRRTTTAGSRARSASADLDAALVAAARTALRRGPVADGRARRPVAVHRGLPGPAAAGRRRRASRSPARWSGSRASSATRRSWSTAGRRSRRAERFPDVDRLVVGWPDEVADEIGLGPNDAVAVLTHDVKFDEPAIVEALRRGCRYVGAVGSRKTQADRRARLLEAGVSEAELDRLRGPIGLDLGGRAPAETALAILAEIVAERYGGSGAPMRERAAAVPA